MIEEALKLILTHFHNLVTTKPNPNKKRKGNRNGPGNQSKFPHEVQKLIDAAGKRNTRLMIMPQGMSKRVNNTTYYIHHTNSILWKIHVVFILNNSFTTTQLIQYGNSTSISDQNLSFIGRVFDKINENTTINDILDQCFSADSENAVFRHHLRPIKQHKDNLRCLLQHLPSNANNITFHEVCR